MASRHCGEDTLAETQQPEERADSDLFFGPRLMMQAFQNWQQIINQYTQELLSNRQVLDTSGKASESVMRLKQQADRAMETLVASMQMPTRSEVELIMHKLSALESLVRDLSDKMDQLLEEHQDRS
jgi:hypothetical protein